MSKEEKQKHFDILTEEYTELAKKMMSIELVLDGLMDDEDISSESVETFSVRMSSLQNTRS